MFVLFSDSCNFFLDVSVIFGQLAQVGQVLGSLLKLAFGDKPARRFANEPKTEEE